jgi:hypothetical protein
MHKFYSLLLLIALFFQNSGAISKISKLAMTNRTILSTQACIQDRMMLLVNSMKLLEIYKFYN